MSDDSISWGELAQLTHATQVERFNFCTCEEKEQFPYDDCPRQCLNTEMQTLNLYLRVRCDQYHIEPKHSVTNITSKMLDL